MERFGDFCNGSVAVAGRQFDDVGVFYTLDCCQHQICYIATGHWNSVGMMWSFVWIYILDTDFGGIGW